MPIRVFYYSWHESRDAHIAVHIEVPALCSKATHPVTACERSYQWVLIVLCLLQPVYEPLEPCMFLGVNVHKHEAKADGIGPANLSHFDSEWLVGGREFDMEGQAGTGRQGFLTHHMAPLGGETRDQSASSNITTGKCEWHLNFVTGTVATLHECLWLR
jgi:hypothetical protein